MGLWVKSNPDRVLIAWDANANGGREDRKRRDKEREARKEIGPARCVSS